MSKKSIVRHGVPTIGSLGSKVAICDHLGIDLA